MESQSESIRQLLSRIDNLKANGKVEDLEEHLSPLFDILFSDGGLQSLSSENILNRIDTIMNAYDVWQKYPQKKDAFDERLSVVHAIHSRLYSVLDLRVDIDTLLHERLDSWPTMAEKLEVDFPHKQIEQLQKIREETNHSLSDILDAFFQRYFDALHGKGIDDSQIRKIVEAACNEYARLEQCTDCLALFVERDSGAVSGIQIKFAPGGGNVRSLTNVNEDMNQAARNAISQGLRILDIKNQYDTEWIIDPPNVYEGRSIALPLSIAVFKKLERARIRVDLYTGFTGEIDFQTDSIKKVGGIREKLQGAVSFGLKRVFLPKENEQEARELSIPDLEIISIGSLSEARSILVALSTPMIVTQTERSLEAKIKAFEIKCRGNGLSVSPGKDIGDHGQQIIVGNFRHEIPVNIYYGHKGLRHVVGGNKEIDLYKIVEQFCVEVFGSFASDVRSLHPNFSKWAIKEPSLRSTIKSQLQSVANGKEESEKNCEYRLNFQSGRQSVIVRQFTKGTLTVTGSPAGSQLYLDVCRLIEIALGIPPVSSQSPSLTNENKLPDSTRNSERLSSLNRKAIPSHATSWIGTDESGKGDYFGPLVTAGVCVNRKIDHELRALGVRDSKKLSDKNIREFAKMIRTICKGLYAEVPIPPQTYNNLYNQFKIEGKNLNTLLAWGHARAIENILAKVPCEYALADQFADERFIISKLQEAGRKITLIQMPKAEQDIAVAAASILARDRFLFYLDRMNLEYHMQFPKGASAEVIKVAKEFLARYGKDTLTKVAKLHFRTTKEVLG